MKRRRDYVYFLSLLPACLAISGNLLGSYWTLSNTILLVALSVADWFFREDRRPPEDGSEHDVIPNLVLALHVVTHTLVVASLLYGVCTKIVDHTFILTAVYSSGINSGFSGIIIAHELIHRRQKSWRRAGIWNLLLVHYGHWYVEHIRGHHRYVGTAQDPATARYGENLYHFVGRTVPQQFLHALQLEAARLQQRSRAPYSPANFVVRITVLEVLLMALVLAVLGPMALFVYVAQGLVAIFLLEEVNYLEHYGLERMPDERYHVGHAWRTDVISSRFMLLELTRHSDHHLRASTPFHQLVSHEHSPVLPAGYWGMWPVMLVPPLWFRMVHPILAQVTKAAREACADEQDVGVARIAPRLGAYTNAA